MAGVELFESAEGRAAIARLAAAHGLSEEEARRAVEALVPEIVWGLERNTLSRGGTADLLKALSTGRHDRYLDPATDPASPEVVADGDKILGHILRSPAGVDRAVQRAAGETGLGGALMRSLLPAVAALVMGWLFRGGKGALGDVLGRLPGAREPTGLPDIALPRSPTSRRGTAKGGPLAPPDFDELERLDRERVGNNPYGDLSDILREGGRGSGGLAGTIRDVLGGILGFQSKSWLGWILRLVLLRYGWSILKFFFRRLLGR